MQGIAKNRTLQKFVQCFLSAVLDTVHSKSTVDYVQRIILKDTGAFAKLELAYVNTNS